MNTHTQPTAKPNWPAIRLAYLNQEGSLRVLSQRFNVPLRSLERRCSRENWRQHATRIGGDVAAIAGELAVAQGREIAEKLSLPERSAALRERVVTELERDATLVSETPPKCIADSLARQNVLSGITRNAEAALAWSDRTPTAAVRIHIMGSATVATDREPASLSQSAFPESTEGSEPE